MEEYKVGDKVVTRRDTTTVGEVVEVYPSKFGISNYLCNIEYTIKGSKYYKTFLSEELSRVSEGELSPKKDVAVVCVFDEDMNEKGTYFGVTAVKALEGMINLYLDDESMVTLKLGLGWTMTQVMEK